jgi:cell division protein FtsI/penicillin-binding protein 2
MRATLVGTPVIRPEQRRSTAAVREPLQEGVLDIVAPRRHTARIVSHNPPDWRIYAILAVLMLCAIGLAARLVYWQVLHHEPLREQASDEHMLVETVPPKRGTIRDARNQVLATNMSADLVYAVPAQIKDPSDTAAKLAPVLGRRAEDLQKLLADRTRQYVRLSGKVPPDVSRQVRELRLPGIFLEPTTRRVYPEGPLAAHVLGYANFDNRGQYGVEGSYDSIVGGKPGRLLAERDTAGREIAIGDRHMQPPVDGADLVLTIDLVIQHIVERELDAALARWKAPSGTVIVMQPKTGAILAMASRPTFDPNQYEQYAKTPEIFVNPAVGRLYEPGSTFKVITVAAALDSGRATPRTTYFDSGAAVYGGWTLRNWDGRGRGVSTLADLLRYSSNVGAAHVAYNLLGKDLFYQYVRNFGFGAPTGVGLQGEEKGIIKDPASPGWYPVDLATNSYGQGISVTPLQLITAIAAVANDGLLMRPYVVQKIISPTETRETKPEPVRQVISPQTARILREMLVGVVENGETRYAAVPGYRVAGKTGTASIPMANGRYESDATIASFIGMLPADDPQVVILVKIDRPQGEPWGSTVAAPVFKNIAQDLATYLRIPPSRPVTQPTPAPVRQ